MLGHLHINTLSVSPSYLPKKMEQTECSKTSAYKIQTPGNYPEEHTTFRTRRKFEIKSFYLIKTVQTGSLAYTATYSMGTRFRPQR